MGEGEGRGGEGEGRGGGEKRGWEFNEGIDEMQSWRR